MSRNVIHYNLDMIISLGYRVKSKTATQFRIWATEHLKEYLIKGFTMNDEKLRNLGGGSYWHELLERIRDIRSSEKALYRIDRAGGVQVVQGQVDPGHRNNADTLQHTGC